jgi:hypothetical protein
MTRTTSALLAVAVVATLTPVASAAAPTHVGVDHTHSVKFSLTARTLTITLQPVGDQPNPLEASLPGTVLDTACNGRSPKTGKAIVASKLSVTWPSSGTALTVKLNRDVSAHVRWCVIERQDTGADIAVSEKMRVPRPTTPAALN